MEGLLAHQVPIFNDAVKDIDNLPPRITDLVAVMEFHQMGRKTVVCNMRLHNGYEITTYSAPINIQDFNYDLGKVLAKKKAYDELCQFERYVQLRSNASIEPLFASNIIGNGHACEEISEGE